jgi:hypothetical protein
LWVLCTSTCGCGLRWRQSRLDAVNNGNADAGSNSITESVADSRNGASFTDERWQRYASCVRRNQRRGSRVSGVE